MKSPQRHKERKGIYLLAVAVLLLSGCNQTTGNVTSARPVPSETPFQKPILTASATQPEALVASDTPTPTVTPALKPFDFKEITYQPGGIGGGGDEAEICTSYYTDQNLAQVSPQLPFVALVDVVLTDQALVCLFGFPTGIDLKVKLFVPAGQIAAQFILQANPIADQGVSATGMSLTRSLALPFGDWNVTVQAKDVDYTGSLPFGRWDVQAVSLGPITPAGLVDLFDPRWYAAIRPGDTLRVMGIHQSANQDVPIAIYRIVDSAGTSMPVTGGLVHTDAQGAFDVRLTIDAQQPGGDYLFIVFNDPTVTTIVDDYSHHDRLSFQVSAAQALCDQGPRSYIEKGFWAYIAAGLPNNLRDKPRLDGNLIGKLAPLTPLKVLDGPECNDGLTWWQVVNQDGSLKGWIAEGDEKAYWLLPLAGGPYQFP